MCSKTTVSYSKVTLSSQFKKNRIGKTAGLDKPLNNGQQGCLRALVERGPAEPLTSGPIHAPEQPELLVVAAAPVLRLLLEAGLVDHNDETVTTDLHDTYS